MNYEMNEMNHFDREAWTESNRSTDLPNLGLDVRDPISSAIEKDNTAVGNPPEHLDLEAWEGKTGDRFWRWTVGASPCRRLSNRVTAREAGTVNTSATQQWAKQFGSSMDDYSNEITTDSSGNVYLTGSTWGNLAGKNAGSDDVWVAKYDSNGDRIWAKQFGTNDRDNSTGITTDSNGNVYLTGDTRGNLAGENSNWTSVWVAKYDSNGDRIWAKQFGTSNDSYSNGITTDSNDNVYLTGSTEGNLAGENAGWSDTWIAKYSSSGDRIWSKQFGTSGPDSSNGITTDSSGNVYLTGSTRGNLAGENAGQNDVWVAKYDSNGDRIWAKQFGTSHYDYSSGITIDSGSNVYLTGFTYGNLAGDNNSWSDVWVAKYDSDGDRIWARQFGASNDDYSNGIKTDSSGNVYLTGFTYGDLASDNAGSGDAWVAKYDSNKEQLEVQQFGTSGYDSSNGITTDSSGNVYLTGYTEENLVGDNSSSGDAWVAKIKSLPQPTVSISATDANAAETTSGETNDSGEFTITRTGDTTDPLTVNYYVDGKAKNGEDYQKLMGSIIIPAKETKVSVLLEVVDDDKTESSEKVNVILKSHIFYSLDKDKSATLTISDNDRPVVSIFAIDAKTKETLIGETPNPGRLKVSRAGDLSNPLTVGYKVSGTATKGTDYKLPKKITFAAGVSTVGVPINILDDALVERVESANIILTSNPNYNLAKAKVAKVSIADND
jgi:hypothetical protein